MNLVYRFTDRGRRWLAMLVRQPRHGIGCAVAVAAMAVARWGLRTAAKGRRRRRLLPARPAPRPRRSSHHRREIVHYYRPGATIRASLVDVGRSGRNQLLTSGPVNFESIAIRYNAGCESPRRDGRGDRCCDQVAERLCARGWKPGRRWFNSSPGLTCSRAASSLRPPFFLAKNAYRIDSQF